jgi:hypothetical protein
MFYPESCCVRVLSAGQAAGLVPERHHFRSGLGGRGDQRCIHRPDTAIVLWLADYSDGSLLRLRRRFEKTSVDTQRWAPGDNIRGDRKI